MPLFVFLFVYFAIKFRVCWQFSILKECKARKNEAKRRKRFKIIFFSRSTYTNIIYLHVVFEITMLARIVLLWTVCFACVYFINLFMFMNIIPHKNLSEKRRLNKRERARRTLKRCLGFRVTSSISDRSSLAASCREL